jgi:deoxyribodipyrimidine photo-lyase
MTTPHSPVLVWLRNDLRLDDHEPFHRAVSGGAPVIPIFCVDPRQFGTLPTGVPKTGPFRARFLIESLTDLRARCRDIGGELIVRKGRPEQVLPALARETGATRVHYHEEVASEETTVEAELDAALRAINVECVGHWGHTLLHPDDLPFDLDALPAVFTQFRTRVEDRVTPRPCFPIPRRLDTPAMDPGALPTLESLGLIDPAADPRARFVPRGDMTGAHERLEHYLWQTNALGRYKETRNGLLTVDDSSKLSPWLALGCLSPRRVYTEVRRYETERMKNDSTYWLIFELLWRDYFRFVAARWGDRLFALRGLHDRALPWRAIDDPSSRADFARWSAGHTGFPLIDAAMQELAATGYTSNRARQNVASFLTKNLGIDWRAGAEWFESMLIDYDVASNWGNWLYSAGVGNDARGFRFFNTYKQAADYDPEGAFVRHWLPALSNVPGGTAHRPEQLTPSEQSRWGLRLGEDYPLPMVDLFASARAQEQRYVAALGAPSSGGVRRPRRR